MPPIWSIGSFSIVLVKVLDRIREKIDQDKILSTKNLEDFYDVEQKVNYQVIQKGAKEPPIDFPIIDMIGYDLSNLGLTCLPDEWIHSIENIGTENLIVFLWSNENFNVKKPDTFTIIWKWKSRL